MPRGYPGTKAPHGTPTRYDAHACRCAECRDAWTVYNRERLGQLPRSVYEEQREAPHGTESRYKRCRCDECREASRLGRANRRKKVAA